MNIWLIQTGEPLPIDDSVKKMRTALLADKLLAKGHSVTWWTSAFDHIKKEWIYTKDTEVQKKNGLKFLAIKGTGYKSNVSLMRFIDHRIVARKFSKMASKMAKPDFILASMPPHDFAYQAVMYANRNNIPVLVDIRDPWPDIFLEHLPSSLRTIAKIVLFNDFGMVKKTMSRANGLVAVTNEFLNWGLQYAGRKKSTNDKLFYLGHKSFPMENRSAAEEKFRSILDKTHNKFIVLFIGTISGSYHNPLILLQAAEKLSANKNIHFVIAGDGDMFEKLKTESKQYDNVSLTGWLNRDEIEFWLQRSSIGICPATKEVHLPTNKAYAYLSAGLPIISAFQGELKMLIEKYKIGLYYPPNDVDSLAENIKKLQEDKLLYQEASDNAKKIFKELFDADIIYENYANHIEQMASNKNNS